MSSELGKLEKPEAAPYLSQRKIYLVPLVFAPRKPSQEYAELFERYWRGVREHLLKLEISAGPITRVFHEGIGLAGEEGLVAAEKVSEKSGSLGRSKVSTGATFEALEDQELVAESFDWQRCLMIGLESRKASELLWNNYSETNRLRYEVMAKRLNESLRPEEAGLLFISEEHRVQFPSDLQVFFVAPPALDEIHRWIRDQQKQPQPAEEESAGEP